MALTRSTDRSGLGKEEEERRQLEEAMQKRAKVETQSVESFKAQQAAKFKERFCFSVIDGDQLTVASIGTCLGSLRKLSRLHIS